MNDPAPAITRDGRTVAYVTQHGTEDSQLYLRDLNAFEARAVGGSRGAKQPFFSPDGKWVGFFAQGQLQKVEVAGGAPIRLAEAPLAYGGTWSDDHTIIYTPSLGSGLWRVPASGGSAESLTTPDGAAKGYAHTYPASLPGGSLVFTVWGQSQGGAVLSLDSREWELILPGKTRGAPIFEAVNGSMGRLLVVDEAAGIRAAPLDAAHPARTSADASVLANVYYDAPGDPAQVSLVTLLFLEIVPATGRDLLTLSPDGKVAALRVTPANETAGQFSPGGTGSRVWLAYESDESGRSEIYVQSYPGGTNRIPVSIGGGFLPTWSRDGKELFYVTGDAVVAVTMRPDGSFGVPRRLFDRANYFLRFSSSYDAHQTASDS